MCCAICQGRKTHRPWLSTASRDGRNTRSLKWCKHSSCTIMISVGKLKVCDLIELNWAIAWGSHYVHLDIKHLLGIMPPQPPLSCVIVRFVELENKGEEECSVGWMPKTGSMSNDKVWWLSTHPRPLESVTWQVIFSFERVAFE